MASDEEISDIYEVPRPEPVVEPELVNEPEEEEPFMDPEEEPKEDPEEDREEDHAILEYAADDVALAEEELEGDQRIPDQGMGAVVAAIKTVIDLMERNQQLENKLQEVENKAQQLEKKAQQLKDGNEELKVLCKREIATRIRLEGVAAELRIKKRRLDRMLYL